MTHVVRDAIRDTHVVRDACDAGRVLIRKCATSLAAVAQWRDMDTSGGTGIGSEAAEDRQKR